MTLGQQVQKQACPRVAAMYVPFMGHGLQGLIQVGKEVFRREGGHHLGAGTLSKMAEHQVK